MDATPKERDYHLNTDLIIEPGRCYRSRAGTCSGRMTTPSGKVYQDAAGNYYLRDGRSLSMWENELNPRDLMEVCGCKSK